MRSFLTGVLSVLSVAAVTTAYANPSQWERDTFERALQQRDLFQRNAMERDLYERQMYERAMFERDLARRGMEPTRTLNIPRSISSPALQSDVIDPAISAAALVAGSFIPGIGGKIAAPVIAKTAVDGYNHLAANKEVDHVASEATEDVENAWHHVKGAFTGHHRRANHGVAYRIHARKAYAEAGPEFGFEKRDIYARDALPEAFANAYAEAYAIAYADAYAEATPDFEERDLYARDEMNGFEARYFSA